MYYMCNIVLPQRRRAGPFQAPHYYTGLGFGRPKSVFPRAGDEYCI